MAIAVGDRISRVPDYMSENGFPLSLRGPRTGKVLYINEAHHWCLLEYEESHIREGVRIIASAIPPKPDDPYTRRYQDDARREADQKT